MSRFGEPDKPSEVTSDRAAFDRFSEGASRIIGSGAFMLAVWVGILVWAGYGWKTDFSVKWLDIGALLVGIPAVLIVMIIENQHRRSDQAIQRKLNAIAEALADFMHNKEVPEDVVKELASAVGLEDRESVSRSD